MTLWQAFLLGIIQGITEFLPISSSGHLVLVESFLGLKVEELLSFDVMLHAGTLLALIVYFWRTLVDMVRGLWIDLKRLVFKVDSKMQLRDGENSREQVWFLIVATLPVVFLGPYLKDLIEQSFRSPAAVMAMLGVTALLLAMAEVLGRRTEPRVDSLKTALMMGFFQVLAVIPGISRSGSTIVGGLLGKLEREAAARFAFLMAIPAIGGATIFLLKDLFQLGSETVSWQALTVGFLSSALVSFVSVWGMLKFLKKRSLWWFVAYLLIVNGAWFVFGAV